MTRGIPGETVARPGDFRYVPPKDDLIHIRPHQVLLVVRVEKLGAGLHLRGHGLNGQGGQDGPFVGFLQGALTRGVRQEDGGAGLNDIRAG